MQLPFQKIFRQERTAHSYSCNSPSQSTLELKSLLLSSIILVLCSLKLTKPNLVLISYSELFRQKKTILLCHLGVQCILRLVLLQSLLRAPSLSQLHLNQVMISSTLVLHLLSVFVILSPRLVLPSIFSTTTLSVVLILLAYLIVILTVSIPIIPGSMQVLNTFNFIYSPNCNILIYEYVRQPPCS